MNEPLGIFTEFYRLLEAEYQGMNPFLEPHEHAALRKYYQRYFKCSLCRPCFENLYYSRLKYIGGLLCTLSNLKVLDAGCGLGSESIFFSLLGARVVGADLDERRIRVAQKRKMFYNKLIKQEPDFIAGDIFEIVRKQRFDVVWMNEAISHIHPAEGFLRLVRQQLTPGGRLIISEGNGANPLLLVRRLIRTGHFSWTVKYLQRHQAGRRIGYARERLFSKDELAKILERSGYSIGHVEFTPITVFFSAGPGVVRKVANAMDQWLNRHNANKMLGISYRIEAFLP